MLHPNQQYSAPKEVMKDNKLSNNEKISVLNNWADIINQKLEATAENMNPKKDTADDAETLRQITSCLEKIK